MFVHVSHGSNPQPPWLRISACRASSDWGGPAVMTRILTIALLLCAALAPAAAGRSYPETIPLPDGWQPEGIATGRGNAFYVGSIPTGAVYKGNLKTGRGDVLVPGQAGRAATGLKVDRRNRLFVSGAATGKAFVYDAGSGQLLREYTLTAPPTFVNDVTVTRKAAYFTDSRRQQLYVLRLGRRGALPDAACTLALTGDLQYDNDPDTFELNGIAAARGGKRLITIQSRTGKLFLVNPRTGRTREIDLHGASLPNGDGILLRGRTLWVVQNRLNQIAVVKLGRRLHSGRVIRTLTDSDLDVPTTIARKGGFLWAVNARFGTPPTPMTEYDVVRVDPD
jgi:sugar lactone lactonase YvrE